MRFFFSISNKKTAFFSVPQTWPHLSAPSINVFSSLMRHLVTRKTEAAASVCRSATE